MKYLQALFLVLIVACTHTERDAVSLNKVVTTFLGGSEKDAYNIKLFYTVDGKFDFLTSTATAQVGSLYQTERDEALKAATIKAKQQVFEFIKNTIESERFISSVVNSIQNSDAVPKHKGTPSDAKLAHSVRDSIKSKSDAILQDAYVSDAVLDLSTGLIVVTVRSGRKN